MTQSESPGNPARQEDADWRPWGHGPRRGKLAGWARHGGRALTLSGILANSFRMGTSNTSRRSRCCSIDGRMYLRGHARGVGSHLEARPAPGPRPSPAPPRPAPPHLQSAMRQSSMTSRCALVSERPRDRRYTVCSMESTMMARCSVPAKSGAHLVMSGSTARHR